MIHWNKKCQAVEVKKAPADEIKDVLFLWFTIPPLGD